MGREICQAPVHGVAKSQIQLKWLSMWHACRVKKIENLDDFKSIYVWCIYIHTHIYICCCLDAKSCGTLLWPHGLQPTRPLCSWYFPGKNTGEGWHFLLRGIFPTPGLNPWLLHWQADSLPLNYLGNPYIISFNYSCPWSNYFLWSELFPKESCVLCETYREAKQEKF